VRLVDSITDAQKAKAEYTRSRIKWRKPQSGLSSRTARWKYAGMSVGWMTRSRFWNRLSSRFYSKRWAGRDALQSLELRKVAALEALVSRFDELIIWVRLLNNRGR